MRSMRTSESAAAERRVNEILERLGEVRMHLDEICRWALMVKKEAEDG